LPSTLVGEVGFDQIDPTCNMGKVLRSTSREIVDDSNRYIVRQQRVDQMTADKTGTAGYHCGRHSMLRGYLPLFASLHNHCMIMWPIINCKSSAICMSLISK